MALFYDSYHVGDQLLADFPKEEQNPLLLTFSKIQNAPNDENPSHMHAHLECFYFESGSGIFECNKQKVSVGAHDLLVVNAQNFHTQYSLSSDDPLIFYNITADRIRLGGLSPNTLSGRSFEYYHFSDQENDIFRTIVAIQRELRSREYRYAPKIHALFQSLMIDVIRLFGPREEQISSRNKEPSNQARMAQIKSYMEAHYAENLTISDFCRLAMLQKSYFLKQFKEIYSIPPIRYLNLIRIEKSKLLLANSEKNITEIAAEVGFNHPSYFSEMFLKFEGVSPTQYRKTLNETAK